MKILLFIYHVLVEIRNFLYKFKILKSYKIKDSFVISVGNITFGGTGKTPVVMALAEKYLKNGKIVAVVSRGYKRKSKDEIIVAPDQEDFKVEDIGDEPYMIKKRLPKIWLGVGANRKSVIEKLPKVDYIILDDGFQKLSIRRDQNILLIDATSPFYLLREFLKNIVRSDLIIITKSNLVSDTSKIEEMIRKYTDVKIIKSEYKAQKIEIVEKKVSILTAIGNPESFVKTVENLGLQIDKKYIFKDHHWFTEDDFKYIDSDVLVVTEKDAVKLEHFLEFSNFLKHKKVYVLKMDCI